MSVVLSLEPRDSANLRADPRVGDEFLAEPDRQRGDLVVRATLRGGDKEDVEVDRCRAPWDISRRTSRSERSSARARPRLLDPPPLACEWQGHSRVTSPDELRAPLLLDRAQGPPGLRARRPSQAPGAVDPATATPSGRRQAHGRPARRPAAPVRSGERHNRAHRPIGAVRPRRYGDTLAGLSRGRESITNDTRLSSKHASNRPDRSCP